MNLRTKNIPTWCPGCDDYLMLAGIIQAITAKNIDPKDVVIVYDIGCAGNMADFINTYAIHTLHGRSVATAIGVKLANPKLTVIVVGGDGGIYGEGLNHLIAAARSNIDITVLVSNNYLYSLTTGQTSPTTPKGSKTKSTPLGVENEPVNAIRLLHSINPDLWVETVTAKQVILQNQKIKQAIDHSGFALLDIDQACASFGKQLR